MSARALHKINGAKDAWSMRVHKAGCQASAGLSSTSNLECAVSKMDRRLRLREDDIFYRRSIIPSK